jgi:hypothetical protein
MVEAILDGRADHAPTLAETMGVFPVEWNCGGHPPQRRTAIFNFMSITSQAQTNGARQTEIACSANSVPASAFEQTLTIGKL